MLGFVGLTQCWVNILLGLRQMLGYHTMLGLRQMLGYHTMLG